MPVFLLAFLIVPIVELIVIIQVGRQIGGWWTILLLVAMSVAGAVLLRREGARTWRSFTATVGTGRLPAREVADGALVLFGGALLLTPGFLSDVLGLLCLLPPSRVVLRRMLMGVVARRFVGAPGAGGRAFRILRVPSSRDRTGAPGGSPPGPRRTPVIDGELGEPPRPEG